MPPKINLPDGYMTVASFARKCGVSAPQVLTWIHSGKIPYVKVGSMRFVPVDAKKPPYKQVTKPFDGQRRKCEYRHCPIRELTGTIELDDGIWMHVDCALKWGNQ